jgi:hypothetical protein
MSHKGWIIFGLNILLLVALGAAFVAGVTPASGTTQAPTIAGDELWASQFVLGANNPVNAIVVAPNGDVYIGGSFNSVAGVSANGVAKWSASSNRWSALGSGVVGTVWALAISGNYLYAGGTFTSAGGTPVNEIARWNISSGGWSSLGSGPAHAITAPFIRALAVDGSGNLYVGGRFDSAGGVASRNVARWNGTAWSGLGGGIGATADSVDALAISGSDIYAGGSFSSPSGNLAQFNGVNWTPLSHGVNGKVDVLALSGSDLYLGGEFTQATDANGPKTVNYLAQWHIPSSTFSSLSVGLNGFVYAILVSPGGIYAAGTFTMAGGNPASHVALWDGNAWSTLQNQYAIQDGVDSYAFALALSGNDLYVGGQFTSAGGRLASYVARWNVNDRQWYSPGNGPNGNVYAVAVNGNDVYVAGDFSSAGGLTANGVTFWNRSSGVWSSMGSGLAGCTGVFCLGPKPFAIAINGNSVYVGGNFQTAGGVTVNNIARWDSASKTWSALDGGVTGCNLVGCGAIVYTIVDDGGGVDVGGLFNNIGATTANNIGLWNGSAWETFTGRDDGITGTNDTIFAIAPDGAGDYYIGGQFSSPRAYYVFFDGYDWYSPQSAPNGTVRAILLLGNDVYIGGDFTNAAGSGANHIARASGSGNWTPLGNSLNDVVTSLSLQGNNLYAGGLFTQAGTLGVDYIARWDTVKHTWSNLGSGTNDAVLALAADKNFVYAGGDFTTAGNKISAGFSIWGQVRVMLPLVMR